jgi:hypothetical protein
MITETHGSPIGDGVFDWAHFYNMLFRHTNTGGGQSVALLEGTRIARSDSCSDNLASRFVFLAVGSRACRALESLLREVDVVAEPAELQREHKYVLCLSRNQALLFNR